MTLHTGPPCKKLPSFYIEIHRPGRQDKRRKTGRQEAEQDQKPHRGEMGPCEAWDPFLVGSPKGALGVNIIGSKASPTRSGDTVPQWAEKQGPSATGHLALLGSLSSGHCRWPEKLSHES